jgi:hypothetical protein
MMAPVCVHPAEYILQAWLTMKNSTQCSFSKHCLSQALTLSSSVDPGMIFFS